MVSDISQENLIAIGFLKDSHVSFSFFQMADLITRRPAIMITGIAWNVIHRFQIQERLVRVISLSVYISYPYTL